MEEISTVNKTTTTNSSPRIPRLIHVVHVRPCLFFPLQPSRTVGGIWSCAAKRLKILDSPNHPNSCHTPNITLTHPGVNYRVIALLDSVCLSPLKSIFLSCGKNMKKSWPNFTQIFYLQKLLLYQFFLLIHLSLGLNLEKNIIKGDISDFFHNIMNYT